MDYRTESFPGHSIERVLYLPPAVVSYSLLQDQKLTACYNLRKKIYWVTMRYVSEQSRSRMRARGVMEGHNQMPSSTRRKVNITISDAALRSWARSGMRLKDIQRKIYETTGWSPDISTISKWLKDMGEEPRHKTRREFMPWDIRPEHKSSRFRIMLQAAERREKGLDLSETDTKALNLLDDMRMGRGTTLVVGYHPEVGFYLTDATDNEVKTGAIIRQSTELDFALSPEELSEQAFNIGATPERLEDAGRSDAADLLRSKLNPRPTTPKRTSKRRAS